MLKVGICFLVLLFFSVLFSNHGASGEIKTEVKSKLVDVNIKSLFKVKARQGDFVSENGKRVWNNILLEINPKNSKIYDEIKPTKKIQEKTIVIFPVFTALAYGNNGFYDYYAKKCDQKCLTIPIQKKYNPTFQSSTNAIQVLKLLGYKFITDIDVDKSPQILKKYNKVILLHSEYVTKTEFKAITNHPNVVYLYPNALYAEVKADYSKNTITLIRGHNYPEQNIRNGFGWKFDNSNLEYNTNCSKMTFDKVNNGWMLNCYPENAIHASKVLLKTIRDI